MHLYRLIPAFIAKRDVENYIFVGRVAKLIGSVFLDRESEVDRKNAVRLIIKKLIFI